MNHRLILFIAVSSLALSACMDREWEVPESIQDNPPYGNNQIEKYPASQVVTIAQLKAQNKSVIDANSKKEITDDVQLQVAVNGNDAGGNIYKQISVQDETGGIIIGINATDQFAFLPVGQKLLINLKGLYIGGYGGQAQLGTLYNGGIGRIDREEWEKHIRLVKDDIVSAKADTIDFNANIKDYNTQTGRIVKLSGVTMSRGSMRACASCTARRPAS